MNQNNRLSSNINNDKLPETILNKRPVPKNTRYILSKSEIENQFDFNDVKTEINAIVQAIIQQNINERNTILLAKLARQNILKIDSKNMNYSHNVMAEMQDSLVFKSLEQINQYLCAQISSKIVKRIVNYLKCQDLSAKVMSTAIVFQTLGFGFNLGGFCFWNDSTDGQITLKKKIPPLPQNIQQETLNHKFDKEGILVVTVYMCRFQKRFRAK